MVAHINDNGSMPLLQEYFADGTPCRIRFARRRLLNNGDAIIRKAQQSREMYSQRLMLLRRDHLNQPLIFTLYKDALPCVRHTTWVMTHILDEFFPLLRELGFTGLQTTVYCFDGGVFDALYRRARQRHMAYYANEDNLELRERLQNQDHTLGILCALHKISTAGWWAVKHWLDDSDSLDVIWKMHASLVNSLDIIAGWIPCVYANVTWVDPPSFQAVEMQTQFWTLLGVETNIVEQLVEMCLWWNPITKTLELNRNFCQDDQWEYKAYTAILGVLQVRHCRSNRFAKIGRRAGRLVACWGVGLDHIVSSALAAKESSWYLGGYELLTPALRHLTILKLLQRYERTKLI